MKTVSSVSWAPRQVGACPRAPRPSTPPGAEPGAPPCPAGGGGTARAAAAPPRPGAVPAAEAPPPPGLCPAPLCRPVLGAHPDRAAPPRTLALWGTPERWPRRRGRPQGPGGRDEGARREGAQGRTAASALGGAGEGPTPLPSAQLPRPGLARCLFAPPPAAAATAPSPRRAGGPRTAGTCGGRPPSTRGSFRCGRQEGRAALTAPGPRAGLRCGPAAPPLSPPACPRLDRAT